VPAHHPGIRLPGFLLSKFGPASTVFPSSNRPQESLGKTSQHPRNPRTGLHPTDRLGLGATLEVMAPKTTRSDQAPRLIVVVVVDLGLCPPATEVQEWMRRVATEASDSRAISGSGRAWNRCVVREATGWLIGSADPTRNIRQTGFGPTLREAPTGGHSLGSPLESDRPDRFSDAATVPDMFEPTTDGSLQPSRTVKSPDKSGWRAVVETSVGASGHKPKRRNQRTTRLRRDPPCNDARPWRHPLGAPSGSPGWYHPGDR